MSELPLSNENSEFWKSLTKEQKKELLKAKIKEMEDYEVTQQPNIQCWASEIKMKFKKRLEELK